MVSGKIRNRLAAALICSLLLVAGCAQTSTLALKFTPEDSTTYRVIMERERSVEFEGALSEDKALQGGSTGDKIEMTFTQQIQDVDDKGNSIALITINELKYLAKEKDVVKADFDSSREQDRRSLLAKLIGQSYKIKISPAGQVVGVVDVRAAQAAVKGRAPANKTALALLKPEVIKERHTILTLPPAGKNKARKGDSWSSVKTFDLGLMGVETYERIYTLKEVKNISGRRISVVEMNAIPSSEMAEQLHKEGPTRSFPDIFGGTKTYTYSGQLKLDLTAGKVDRCFEKLQVERVIVDSSVKPGDDKEPDVMRMGVIRLYSLERID